MELATDAIERAKPVKMVIFDVDGVMTDGGIYTGREGELYKPFFCRDGLGITLAQRAGLLTAIINGRTSECTAKRAEELHISAVWQGYLNKRGAYLELKEKFGLKDEEIAYIGDDLIDLPIMLQVGFPAAVADAVPEVRGWSVMVSGLPGGRGAVREILEFILKAKGLWEKILEGYLSAEDTSSSGIAQ
ncbi:MAG: HAD hydrolase family protein [Selenomonadaceae bacterium]|nr:HAD hydrolase family protein [Selenomonadaceae bacterium]